MTSSSSLQVTSRAATVVHTLRRSPTCSLTPVLKMEVQVNRWARVKSSSRLSWQLQTQSSFQMVRFQWMPEEDTQPRMGWVIFLKPSTALKSKYVSPAESSPKTSSQVGPLEQILSRSSRCLEPWQRSSGWLRGAEERGPHCWLILTECVEGAFVKGASNALDLGDTVSAFWDIYTVHDLATFVASVPADSNVSDQVCRGSFLEVEKRGGVWVDHAPPLWIVSGDAWSAELDRRMQTPESQSSSS